MAVPAPAPAPKEAIATQDEEEAAARSRLDCVSRPACIEIAIDRNWRAFACAGCSAYEPMSRGQLLDEAPGLLALLGWMVTAPLPAAKPHYSRRVSEAKIAAWLAREEAEIDPDRERLSFAEKPLPQSLTEPSLAENASDPTPREHCDLPVHRST